VQLTMLIRIVLAALIMTGVLLGLLLIVGAEPLRSVVSSSIAFIAVVAVMVWDNVRNR
jgi:hypothetical protein